MNQIAAQAAAPADEVEYTTAPNVLGSYKWDPTVDTFTCPACNSFYQIVHTVPMQAFHTGGNVRCDCNKMKL